MTTVIYDQQALVDRRANRPVAPDLSSLLRGWWQKVRSAVTRQSIRLLDLTAVEATHSRRGIHYLGTKSIPIGQIRGSENRSNDFDINFRPLKNHNEERWLGIAAARLKGVALPAVDLIQIEDIYFVRDGHHRISVARAFGQEYIDAKVTLWEMDQRLSEAQPSGSQNIEEVLMQRLENSSGCRLGWVCCWC